MADIEDRLVTWLRLLCTELDARMPLTEKLDRYAAGYPDVPEHVKEIKAETEYRVLLRQAVTNWPELIVESSAERMELIAFEWTGQPKLGEQAQVIFEQAELDADSNDLHEAMLTNGRAYALVWPTRDGGVTITLEHASTTIVAYNTRTGEPKAALRRWEDDGKWYANLFLTDGLYKFEGKDKSRPNPDGKSWVPRQVPDETWPLPNWAAPDIPVVEFTANSSLSGLASSADQCGNPRKVSRIFGSAHGDFERVLPIVDRINTTIFAGLLGQAFASFPVRALIGDPMNYRPVVDSNGDPVLDEVTGEPMMEPTEPFKAAVNRLVQIENPDGKLVQLDPQDLGNYTKFAQSHVSHLAAITKTPSYYFGDLVNISADTIRASEAGHIKKVKKHSRRAGKSWARVMRLAMIATDNGGSDLLLPRVKWSSPETRSMAEAADAARKLVGVIPWTAIAERFLNATPEEIRQWQADMAIEALNAQPLMPDVPASPDLVPA